MWMRKKTCSQRLQQVASLVSTTCCCHSDEHSQVLLNMSCIESIHVHMCMRMYACMCMYTYMADMIYMGLPCAHAKQHAYCSFCTKQVQNPELQTLLRSQPNIFCSTACNIILKQCITVTLSAAGSTLLTQTWLSPFSAVHSHPMLNYHTVTRLHVPT